MHSFTRSSRRSRTHPPVEQAEIEAFLGLSPAQQFEDLRELRMSAAHLGGGSLSAFSAIYISIVVGALPLISSAWPDGFGSPAVPFALGAFILGGGFTVALAFVRYQQEMARAATRLAFYEDALNHANGIRRDSGGVNDTVNVRFLAP